jgi:hypothetical protein
VSHPRVHAVFQTTHATLSAEKALKEAGLDVRTAVKPAGIGQGCQMALTMPLVSMELAVRICLENRIVPPSFYTKGDDGQWTPVDRFEG